MADPIKKLIYLQSDGRLKRVENGAITNIGGTSNSTFTVNGKGLLFDDGTSTGGGGNSGTLSVTLQNAYDNQKTSSSITLPINLHASQDVKFLSTTGNYFSIEGSTGNVFITGLINGILFDDLIAHVTLSSTPKHAASEISITSIPQIPSATTVQEALEQINTTIQNNELADCLGFEYVVDVLDPQKTWTVIHNKNTRKIHWAIWDELDEWVMPNAVKILDNNTIQINFGAPQAGRLVLITF